MTHVILKHFIGERYVELIKAKKSIKNSNKNMKDAFKRMYEKELLAEEAESTKSTIPAPVSIIENPKVIPSTYYM